MAAPRNSTRANFVEFKGLANARGRDGVPFGGFYEATNVDITRDSKVQRRPGRAKVYTGEVVDVWGDGKELLFVTAAGDLRRLATDETSEVLRSGLTGVGRLSAARVADTVYWSYGAHQGVIEEDGTDRAFGLSQLAPAGHVSLAASARLPAGRYRYAWASVTDDDDEGPIGLRGVFELSSRGGMELVPPIPEDARATRVRAYLTEPNGTQLYRLATIDAPANAGEQAARHVECIALRSAVRPLRENLQALPAFSAAGIHNGRLLAAYDDLLLYSDRFDFEYFSPEAMYIPFSSRVTVVAPVRGGVFVATDTDHYFLDGADVSEATLDHKANYGALPHTVDYLEQKEHGFEVSDRVAVWTGRRGPVFGLPNGRMEDSGDGVVSFPASVVHGAGAVRKYSGDTHYISVVRYRG